MQEVWRAGHQSNLMSSFQRMYPNASSISADSFRRDEKMTGLLGLFQGQIKSYVSKTYTLNRDGLLDGIRTVAGVEKGFGFAQVEFFRNSEFDSVLWGNTHLHPTSEWVQLSQLVELGVFLQMPESFDAPLVLAGDFNFPPQSLGWNFLVHVLGFQDAYLLGSQEFQRESCSYCEENSLSWGGGSRRIDHIFFRPSKTQVIEVEFADITLTGTPQSPLSDHYGVRSWLRMGERQSAPSPWPSRQQQLLKQKKILASMIQILKKESTKTRPFYRSLEQLSNTLTQGLSPQHDSPDALVEYWRSWTK